MPARDVGPGVAERRLAAGVAVLGVAVATYLALDQLGVLRAWEPFFGAGTERVLHSSLARNLPVPDAALGALAYLVEAVTAAPFGEGRARRHPRVVALYAVTALGLAAAALGLVVVQAFVVGAFCTLCLASAAISFAGVPTAAREMRAAYRWHRACTTHADMNTRLLDDRAGVRTFAIVFDKGDEVASGLEAFAARERLGGSHFTAIGALSEATLGYFDRDSKRYRKIAVKEQVEVLSLVGDVALDEQGRPKVHAHLVVGKADGTAHGGHLLEARVWPTLEVVLTESPSHLVRRLDPETGLALIRLDAGRGRAQAA